MPKLTQRIADDLKKPTGVSETTGKPISQSFKWCSELRGFGIRCTRAGAKAYVAQGRVGTKERRVTLGPHTLLRCEDARDRAKRVLLELSDGIDPVVQRQKEVAQTTTLREVMEDYILHRRTKHGPLRPHTIADIRKHCTKAFADWLDRPVRDITSTMVLTRFKELSVAGKAQANQAMIILQSLLTWARKANPELPPNPVAVLKGMWHPSKPRTTRIPFAKVGATWNMLTKRQAIVDKRGTRTGAYLAAFLILTGGRSADATRLTWDSVDLDGAIPSWHVKSEKAKNHAERILPLSSQAAALLRGVPCVKGSALVFPSHADAKKPISDSRATWDAVSEVAGLHLSPHDMRRTFLNIALKVGVDFYKAELLTNHVPSHSVTLTHYVETTDLRESCAADVQRVGDWIEQQAAIAAGGNVVPLKPKRKRA